MIGNLEVVVLANLIEVESTGYDLTKKVNQSPWKSSHQQIYRTLLKLTDKGYLTSQKVKQTNKPDKKVYKITQKGLNAVSSEELQLATIKIHQDEAYSRLLLGDPQYFINMHDEIIKSISELTKIRSNSEPLTQLAIDRKINLLHADAEWCKYVLITLSNKIKVAA
ncbi:PadR family transcriptional regulator [Photobacterium gaetbulicola]|uniref:PadR family transcriptional regulator n=1 Tax=Photobacterium gaetbulicola TaxID=1295392 RepID=UPI00068A36F9|nr:PadR family transcriptional regulator [Photobacterium gaetbulicola]